MLKRLGLVSVILVVGLAGCGTDPNLSSTGTTSIHMTSTSIDNDEILAIEVTLVRLVLFHADGTTDDEEEADAGRLMIRFGEGLTLNLLDFQYSQTVTLASVDIPAGDYKKLRMYIAEASLVVRDPNDELAVIRHRIDVPSGKVDIPVSFAVTGGQATDVVLDFDVALSLLIIETRGGNKEFILRPVITPVGILQR